jgi:hypothetical protein
MLAEPLVNASQHALDAFWREIGSLPCGYPLPEGSVNGRERSDAEPKTDLREVLVVGGEVTCPDALCKAKQDRVGEIQCVSIRKMNRRNSIA